MQVSKLFHRWMSAHASHNIMLWYHEVKTLFRLFPEVPHQTYPKESFKKQYDRLYPEVYQRQGEAFNFLLEHPQPMVSSLDTVYQEIEQDRTVFQESSIILRKAKLKAWNTRIASAQLQHQKKQPEVVLEGLSEVSVDFIQLLKRSFLGQGLVLQNCAFRYLPSHLGQIKLRDLTIHHCPLQALPTALGFMSHLRALKVFSTELTELPVEIGSLNLEQLELSDNCLTKLPNSIEFSTLLSKVKLTEQEILSSQHNAAGPVQSLPNYWALRLQQQVISN